jgi:hypothetical protein
VRVWNDTTRRVSTVAISSFVHTVAQIFTREVLLKCLEPPSAGTLMQQENGYHLPGRLGGGWQKAFFLINFL